jgi:hypothetical protein
MNSEEHQNKTIEAINRHRELFLQAVEQIPAAHAVFTRVATGAKNRAGKTLEVFVTEWAVTNRLARPDGRNSWIVDAACRWLRQLSTDPGPVPREFEDDEEASADWVADWRRYSKCLPAVFIGLDDLEVTFRFEAYDRTNPMRAKYRQHRIDEFEAFLRRHIRERTPETVPEPRERRYYDWLVRYHMLGEQYDALCSTAKHKTTEESIKTALSELRQVLELPYRRGAGRPRRNG